MKIISASGAIGLSWCIVGTLLLAWSVRGFLSWRETVEKFSGPRNTILIFACFAAAALVAGALALARKRGAKPLLAILSALALLYAASFVLFGGLDDTGCSYGVAVLALTGLAIVSLALHKKVA